MAHSSITTWCLQHVIGHHTRTNMHGEDPDLYHFNFLTRWGILGFRSGPCSRQEDVHSDWKMGLAVRMPLATLGPSILWDLLSILVSPRGHYMGLVPPVPPSSTRPRLLVLAQHLGHLAGRLLVLLLAIVIPVVRGVQVESHL